MTEKTKKSNKKQPQIKVHFEDVPHFAVSGFFGGLNLNEGSISFFQDRLIPHMGPNPGQITLDTVQHHFVANVKMSPIVFKRMALWMMEHVNRYEKQFGEIKISLAPGKQKSDEGFDYGYR